MVAFSRRYFLLLAGAVPFIRKPRPQKGGAVVPYPSPDIYPSPDLYPGV